MKKSFLIVSFFMSVLAQAQTIQEARKLTDNEQYEAASAIYESLIAKTPADANIYYYYGDNLLLGDNSDSAKIIFEKGKTIDAANPFIKIGKAKLLLNIVNIKEAKSTSEKDGGNAELRERYEQAQTSTRDANALIDEAVLNTKNANVLIEAAEALVHYKTKDLDKAKLLLDKAILLDAKNIEANLLYGDLYTELNNGTLAADYYNRALELDKSSARAIVSKGRLYKRSTNYEGAVQEFLNAIAIEPNYAPAHRELGEAYFKLGKLTQAKEEYKKYLELSKNNCGARIRYATFLYFSKSYADAINELNQVQQRCDSNNLTMLRVQSYCYYENKEYDKGLNTVNHLFRLLTPENRISMDFEYYGKLLIKTSTDSTGILSGIEQLQKAFALDPARVDLLSDLADAWSKLKNYPNAIQMLNQKIATGKGIRETDYNSLGKAYFFNSEFEKADSAAMKASELSPKWTTPWLLRAQSNSHIDSTSEEGRAKPYYEKYIELAIADSASPTFGARFNNGLIESYGYLAYYYILKKDNQNAILYLKKKLVLLTDSDEKKKIQDAIDRLEHPNPKK